MHLLWTIFLVGLASSVSSSNIGATRQDILHDSTDGGYTNILVAIDGKVADDFSMIDTIKVGTSEIET